MSAAHHDDIEGLGIYQVFTGTGTGSGFLIDATHLLTNSHVVFPYREVAVEARDRTRIVGHVRRMHPKRDLAIVELSQPLSGQLLVLDDGAPLRPKQRVNIIGYPVGLPLSLTEGVISHPKQNLDEQQFVQTDAAINPGNSGGPMLDDKRRVVAVTTCKLESAESVGFGIPIADVRAFIDAFRGQTDDFGVVCPACDGLIVTATRYCPSCGLDVEDDHDIADIFDPRDPDPLNAFVESSLTTSGINPVLARHGHHNWSFYAGSAPIRVWCCCSEHLNFSSSLAQAPNSNLAPLFRHLLDAQHAPCFFDLYGSLIRLSLVVHTADIYTRASHAALAERIDAFIRKADASDDALINEYGCKPAPESLARRALSETVQNTVPPPLP